MNKSKMHTGKEAGVK